MGGRPTAFSKVGEVTLGEAHQIDSSRYPPHLSEAGFMQPCPRRIRAVRGGDTVLDTLRAFYVWEIPYSPACYVPIKDVDPSVVALDSTQTFDTGPFAGLVHIKWDSVDSWF